MYGDEEVKGNEVKHWKGRRLWLWPYGPVKVADNRADNYLANKQASMFIGGGAPAKFAEQDNYFKECEAIVKQIIAKMILDRSLGKIVTRIENFTYDKMEIAGSTKFIGMELKFWFYDPTGFEYDETKWNP
jgi:hypothetical protein